MTVKKSPWAVPLKWTSAGVALLMLNACGGGISSALSLTEGNSTPINGISVEDKTANRATANDLGKAPPANQNSTITEAVFQNCQGTGQDMVTPVTRQEFRCAVGAADGYRLNEDETVNVEQACRVALTEDGSFKLSVNGVFDRVHRFSESVMRKDDDDGAGSVYYYKNKDAEKTAEIFPVIAYLSLIVDPSGKVLSDGVALGFMDRMVDVTDPSRGFVKMWFAMSVVNDQKYTCAGVLKKL